MNDFIQSILQAIGFGCLAISYAIEPNIGLGTKILAVSMSVLSGIAVIVAVVMALKLWSHK